VLDHAPDLSRYAARLDAAGRAREVRAVLEPLPLEVQLAAIVTLEGETARRRAFAYVSRGRLLEPELNGDDLIAMGFAPGPGVRRILDALLDEKLDGGLPTREEETAFVQARFRAPDGAPVP
jgi:hypothetical protein